MNKIMKPRHSGDSMELLANMWRWLSVSRDGKNERGTTGGLRICDFSRGLEKKAFESL